MNTVRIAIPPFNRAELKSDDMHLTPAWGISDCIKRFGLGVAAAGIITPLQMGIDYIGQVPGFNVEHVVALLTKTGTPSFESISL